MNLVVRLLVGQALECASLILWHCVAGVSVVLLCSICGTAVFCVFSVSISFIKECQTNRGDGADC